MSVRTVLAVAGTVLIGGLALAEPAAAAAAEASARPVAASVYTLSVGRVGSSLAAVVGLFGAVNGGLALAGGTGSGHLATWVRRRGIVTALVAGVIAVVVGGLIAATAEGGLGTGNGLGGAFVAIIVGLVALVLGATARSRGRTTV